MRKSGIFLLKVLQFFMLYRPSYFNKVPKGGEVPTFVENAYYASQEILAGNLKPISQIDQAYVLSKATPGNTKDTVENKNRALIRLIVTEHPELIGVTKRLIRLDSAAKKNQLNTNKEIDRSTMLGDELRKLGIVLGAYDKEEAASLFKAKIKDTIQEILANTAEDKKPRATYEINKILDLDQDSIVRDILMCVAKYL